MKANDIRKVTKRIHKKTQMNNIQMMNLTSHKRKVALMMNNSFYLINLNKYKLNALNKLLNMIQTCI